MKFNPDRVREKKNSISSKKKKKKAKLVFRVIKYIFAFIFAVLAVVICLSLGVVAGAVHSAPELSQTSAVPSAYSTMVLDSDGMEIVQLSSSGSNRQEATYDELTDNLIYAFVDLEDERFFKHNGIDLFGIFSAVYRNLTQGTSSGASTITQQLIKNNVFSTGTTERTMAATVKRKIQEWSLAMQLEKVMTKEEILISYLNTINLGGGNYGVKEAASYYFDKEISELTLSECAVIAAITQNPSAHNPYRFPENNWERASYCLEKMLQNGHITEDEYEEAINDPPYDRISAKASTSAGASIYSYFVDSLIEQVIEDLQEDAGYTYTSAYNAVYSGGLTIYSTQNTAAQQIVDEEINNETYYEAFDISYDISYNLSVMDSAGEMHYYDQYTLYNYFVNVLGRDDFELNFTSKEAADEAIAEYKTYIVGDGDEITYENTYYTLQPQASFTLMDYSTGYILAMSGGRGEKEVSLSLNRATDSLRQPGSTFKIVASFAPALDTGTATLATAYDDAPFTYPGTDGKTVSNWWGDSYRGLSTVRQAIIDSMNICAIKCLYDVGVQTSLEYLRNFGYESISDDDATLSTAIGGITYGVTNLENCAAFAAIANDGTYIEPKFYSKIVSRDGTIILENNAETRDVVSEEVASLLTSAMQDVVSEGTGVLCDIQSAPLAGKTGTTNDTKDVWFVGYVPNNLIGCIWMGYDENLSLQAYPDCAKPFFSALMDRLVIALDAEGGEFELSENLETAEVCSKSGLLSNGACEHDPAGSCIVTEYFAPGTVPTETCTTHVTRTICSSSGRLATNSCPSTYTGVFRVRPDDIDGTYAKGTTPDSSYAPPSSYCTIHGGGAAYSSGGSSSGSQSNTQTQTTTGTQNNNSGAGTTAQTNAAQESESTTSAGQETTTAAPATEATTPAQTEAPTQPATEPATQATQAEPSS